MFKVLKALVAVNKEGMDGRLAAERALARSSITGRDAEAERIIGRLTR